MLSHLRNPDTLLVALLTALIFALPLAIYSGFFADWPWYLRLAGILALIWASLAAGTWSARKYGARKLNGWFLRSWLRKLLLLSLLALVAANGVIRCETCLRNSDTDDCTGDPAECGTAGTGTEPVVPACKAGVIADLEFYENRRDAQQLTSLKDKPSVLIAGRVNELDCDGDLSEEQKAVIAVLDADFDAAVAALSAAERQARQDELDRQQAARDAEADIPQSFGIEDYTDLNFDVPPSDPPTIDDINDVIDDSRGVPTPGFDRRTVYKNQKYHGLFPTALLGPLGSLFGGFGTRTTVVEEVVAGASNDGFSVEDAITRLSELFEGLPVAEQMRLQDVIAAELEIAVIEGKMSEEDARAIHRQIADATTAAAADEAEATMLRNARAVCTGLLDGKQPDELTIALLGNTPRLVLQVKTCIDDALPDGEQKSTLFDNLREWE